jgi:hypothetical protein
MGSNIPVGGHIHGHSADYSMAIHIFATNRIS